MSESTKPHVDEQTSKISFEGRYAQLGRLIKASSMIERQYSRQRDFLAWCCTIYAPLDWLYRAPQGPPRNQNLIIHRGNSSPVATNPIAAKVCQVPPRGRRRGAHPNTTIGSLDEVTSLNTLLKYRRDLRDVRVNPDANLDIVLGLDFGQVRLWVGKILGIESKGTPKEHPFSHHVPLNPGI